MSRFIGYSPGGTAISCNTVLLQLQHLATTNNDITLTAPYKIKTSHLTSSSSDFCLSSVFCRILFSVGQFSPRGRFWSNRMEITSFSSKIIAFFAVTVPWRFVAVWKETFLYALPRSWRDSVCSALLLHSYSLLWKRLQKFLCCCGYSDLRC
jgi:hypothetical protein